MSHTFFTSYIQKRELLCKEGSEKEIFHIELERPPANWSFRVGDSLGICPQNDSVVIHEILKLLQLTGNEFIRDPKKGDDLSLFDFLQNRVNLTKVTPSFCKACLEKMYPKKKALLEKKEAEKFFLPTYLQDYEIYDFLLEHLESPPNIEEILPFFLKQLPRFYSIASCPDTHPERIDLIVRHLCYQKGTSLRQGVASHFLCKTAKIRETRFSVFVLSSKNFTLPSPSKDIIMIGPGTGIAPFRAFLQQRIFQKASGRNWLFFGEQKRAHHFYYETFFSECEKRQLLNLSTAFSRDQPEKFYVQHQLLKQEKELFSWIEKGAYFYVCGDAKKMAREVEKTLLQIFQRQTRTNEEQAKDYLRKLKEEKRYLLDVY